ncbi:MAG TPA: PAS domain S-box protein, partial [Dehalococcoidia bacterium]|nr:PAS domain S-box protein [Dehalococcoidia bacterium]
MSSEPTRKTAPLRIVHAAENYRPSSSIDFELLVEQSLSLVVLTDSDGVVEYVNPRFCEVTGYRSTEVIGRRVHELGELDPAQAADIWRTVSSGRPWRGEFRAPKKSGELYWVSSTISPVIAGGKILHYLSVNMDITDQRRMEEALRTTEERLKALLTSAPIVVFAWDQAGRVVASEGKGLEPLSHEAGQDIGSVITDVYPEGSPVYENYKRALSGEVVVDVLYAAGRWWTASSIPQRDEDGQIVGVTGVAVDITDQKQAETALAESQARLRLAFDHAQMSAWEWDIEKDELKDSVGEGGPLWSSPRPLAREAFLERVHEEDRPRVAEVIRRVLEEEGAEYDVEFRMAWPDGSTHWVIASGILVRDENGRPQRLSGIALDITGRKKAEEARRQGEERLRLALESARM